MRILSTSVPSKLRLGIKRGHANPTIQKQLAISQGTTECPSSPTACDHSTEWTTPTRGVAGIVCPTWHSRSSCCASQTSKLSTSGGDTYHRLRLQSQAEQGIICTIYTMIERSVSTACHLREAQVTAPGSSGETARDKAPTTSAATRWQE